MVPQPSASRPRLSDPRQAQAVAELAFDPAYIGTPSAILICCDDESRPVGHIHLMHCQLESSPSELTEVLDALVDRAREIESGYLGGLALALTRPGGDEVQAYDRAWFRALYRICHYRGLSAHGVFIVTRTGARQVTMDDAA
jgi:hypothetical protein